MSVHAVKTGFEPRNKRNRAAEDPCLRPHGHRDRPQNYLSLTITDICVNVVFRLVTFLLDSGSFLPKLVCQYK